MQFLNENFLLSNKTAQTLYHSYAKDMPIIDYHCHIDPKDIWEDRSFENLAQLWLGGDHYKWRIMRANGVPEEYITGDAPEREKFQKFAEALARCIGNPMYHWCHLELKNYFGYEGVLNGETAQEVWDLTCKKLKEEGLTARSFVLNSNVEMIGTTDDPTSELDYHRMLAHSDFPVKVRPSFRPDQALNLHKPTFRAYIESLSKAAHFEITTAKDVAKALTDTADFFHRNGCRAADHGLDYVFYRVGTEEEIEAAFQSAMAGEEVSLEAREKYQTYLLLHCARQYHRLGWVMQLHFSCMRNPNTKAFATLGADTGFDCVAMTDSCFALRSVLDALQSEEKLPKTILYSLNAADNSWIVSLMGAFQGEGVRGKIQHGSAWWFNDTKAGMEAQMINLANMGILGNFVGMLTDSRSLLSYARHEYFRRILCNLIGTSVENGEYPADMEALGALVQDISYRNAKEYFGFQ